MCRPSANIWVGNVQCHKGVKEGYEKLQTFQRIYFLHKMTN